MKLENILREIENEISRAKKLHPKWSLDPIHGAAIVVEEAGSAIKAALDFYYGRAGSHLLKKELIHAAAMAIRFLINFEKSETWTNTLKEKRSGKI